MSTINLLPDDYVHRRGQRRANILCIILFLVVMGGVGGASMVSDETARTTREARDRVNTAYGEASQRLAQMQQLEAQKRKGLQKRDATAGLLEKVPRSYLLATVTKALPENASLTRVDLRPPRKPATPAAAKETVKKTTKKTKPDAAEAAKAEAPPPMVVEMEITGWAATDVQVARFIANLLREPLLTSVELSFSQDKPIMGDKTLGTPEQHVREFMVTLQVRPDVDVMDLVSAEPPAEQKPADEPEGQAAAPAPASVGDAS